MYKEVYCDHINFADTSIELLPLYDVFYNFKIHFEALDEKLNNRFASDLLESIISFHDKIKNEVQFQSYLPSFMLNFVKYHKN